jgi:DNA polymerase zeta
VGGSARSWYDEMPKVRGRLIGGGVEGLAGFVRAAVCVVCGERVPGTMMGGGRREAAAAEAAGISSHTVCIACWDDEGMPTSVLTLTTRLAREERKMDALVRVCRSCEGASGCRPREEGGDGGGEEGDAVVREDGVACESLDCPVYYSRKRQAGVLAGVKGVVGDLLGEVDSGW